MVSIKEAMLNGPPSQAARTAPVPQSATPAHAEPTVLSEPSSGGQGAPTLNDEMLAAASYLEKRIAASGGTGGPLDVRTRIEALLQGSDDVGATGVLIDAFLHVVGHCDEAADERPNVEGCMQEVLVWLRRRCAMDAALVSRLSEGLLQGDGNQFAQVRLRCMALLYNSVEESDGNARFSLLLATIQLADTVGLVAQIVHSVLPRIDSFLRTWKTPVAQRKKLYGTACDALRKQPQLAADAFNYHVKLLTLYNRDEASELNSVKTQAINIIVDAIKLPKLFRFDTLLDLDAVRHLRDDSDADLNRLYELICIFVRDDLASFRAFLDQYGHVLKRFDIDDQVAVTKMRLLTFASLGIDSQDLTYGMIAKALNIEEADVEHWVIKAISSGLVDAKINQLKSSVAIYRSTQRTFTREEWLPLSERINIWKQNVGDLLVALEETKSNASSAAANAIATAVGNSANGNKVIKETNQAQAMTS